MSLLDDLLRSGALRVIDHALAQSLRRLDPATPDAVLAAAALASLAVGQGHAAFDPARPQLLFDGEFDWPDALEWQDALRASRWVDAPSPGDASSPHAPLVLENGLLYLRRYREYEYRLARGLQRIAAHAPPASVDNTLGSLHASLFPQARHGDDRQSHAASVALVRSLLLVTGAPGTGKTTTIARLLLLRIAQAISTGLSLPRIALAAPTGRAAERMAASLRTAASQLRDTPGVATMLCDALPTQASTLHRLLGTIPDSPRFRFNAENPLPFDLIVVDEASMVDLPLMCKLTEAVADGAQLILLGDPDQLPSVEAGDVLAAILQAAGDDGKASVARNRPAGKDPGQTPASPMPTPTHALRGHHVRLQQGYRQTSALELSPLAAAVREGDSDTALALLRSGQLAGVHFHENMFDPLAAQRDLLLMHWRALAAIDDPLEALSIAARLRLLTAVREGPQGSRALNARIDEILAGHRAPAYFHGRLLLVTENNYRQRLFNGDIGVCLRGEQGRPVAWFPGDENESRPRAFHPAALPAHESAFAMTVHKAQGSEFENVWLQLPRQPTRVLSRELVYTALTRARSQVHVCASAESLRQALSRRVERVSGLAARLA